MTVEVRGVYCSGERIVSYLTWVLEIELGSSGKASGTLNLRDISPAHVVLILKIILTGKKNTMELARRLNKRSKVINQSICLGEFFIPLICFSSERILSAAVGYNLEPFLWVLRYSYVHSENRRPSYH